MRGQVASTMHMYSKLNEHALIFQQPPLLQQHVLHQHVLQQRCLRDVSIPISLFVVLYQGILLLTLDRVREFLIKISHDIELVPFHVSWMLYLFPKRQMTLRHFVRGNNQIERWSITFTPNGKREFVPRDQDSSLFVVYCSLVLLIN